MERANLEARAHALVEAEAEVFRAKRPRCAAAHDEATSGFFDGVPQHWMLDWPTPFPLVVDQASGVELVDLDGNRIVDVCLGDTGAMFGHGPAPVLEALKNAGTRGLTASSSRDLTALHCLRSRMPVTLVALS